MNNDLDIAYNNALNFAKSHYENFPVVSFLIPKKLRKHIAIVYQFARQADDISDEGNLTHEERLTQLNKFTTGFSNALNGNYSNDFWNALVSTINQFNLTHQLFFDLLTAFKQDITKKRYKDYEELLNYCKHSANPVGRIILELFDIRDEASMIYSDKICTALQLTNFYQDVKVDFEKDRIYLPEDEMKNFGVDKNIFTLSKINSNFEKLLLFQINRTRQLFNEGKKLLSNLPGLLKYEIKWTISGGEEILNKIEKLDFDVLKKRPKLSKIDYFLILIKTFVQ